MGMSLSSERWGMRHAEPRKELLGLGFPLDLPSCEWWSGPEEHKTLLGDTSVSLVLGTTERHRFIHEMLGFFFNRVAIVLTHLNI